MSQHVDLRIPMEAPPPRRNLNERLSAWVDGTAAPAFVVGAPCCESTRRVLGLLASGETPAELAASPRHASILIVVGPINEKLSPRLRIVHQQMARPRRVIAVGACAISGGLTAHPGAPVAGGIERILPVDVHIAGCPVDPGAIVEALRLLTSAPAAGAITPGDGKAGSP